MHGYKCDPNLTSPKKVAECTDDARPGYNTKDASEYLDTNEVLNYKLDLLA